MIPTESDRCQCPCGIDLDVQKTQTRTLILLDVGELLLKEKVKYCPGCRFVFGSEYIDERVPDYCNFGFEIIEFVGMKLFVERLTEREIVIALKERNVTICRREVAFLGKKFILYLAAAHKDKETEIKNLIQRNGGYFAHLDGTCDGASPHVFCAMEELLKLVLLSRKIPSESADAIIPILKELKASYGTPLGIICDMSKAIRKAIKQVFPGVPVFICHYHYLRDIGKDMLKDDHDLLVATMRDLSVKTTLSKLARDLRHLIKNYPSLSQSLEGNVEDVFNKKLPEEVLAHLLIEWIQNYPSDLHGYGFPFDRANIALAKRMREAYEYLVNLTLKPEDRLSRVKDYLEEVLTADFLNLVAKLEKKARYFDRLRAIMRLAPPEGKEGLNDDGEEVDMPSMKAAFEKFIDMEEIKNAAMTDSGYKKMLTQLVAYKDQLFTNGIEVVDGQGNKSHIQPERTNNCMERLFRDEKRGIRKRTGCKSMSKVLKAMLAETPYVKNLKNAEYLKVILNGKATLAERFAEINSKDVRKALKKHDEEQDRLRPHIKKIIGDDNLLKKIAVAYLNRERVAA